MTDFNPVRPTNADGKDAYNLAVLSRVEQVVNEFANADCGCLAVAFCHQGISCSINYNHSGILCKIKTLDFMLL